MHVLVCVMFLCVLNVFGQLSLPEVPLPTGTVKVESNLFMDETEVTNIHWLEYLFYLKKEDSVSYSNALPDTSVWKAKTIPEIGDYRDFYFRYPGFRFYPVVGISYEQAQNYCEWRSEIVTEEFTSQQDKQYRDWEVVFHYRLPTALEWEKLAKTPENQLPPNDQGMPEYVYEHPADKHGLYGLQHNVAEWVEKEIVKGANATIWHPKSPSTVEIPFAEPDYFTGFRCACEVTFRSKKVAPLPSFHLTKDDPKEPLLSPTLYPVITANKQSLRIRHQWEHNFQKLSIYSSNHQLIGEYPLKQLPHQSLHIGRYKPGIYLIKIEDGNKVHEEKIILP